MAKTEMTIADKLNAMAKAIIDNEIDLGFDVEEFVADRIAKAKKKSNKVDEGKIALYNLIISVLKENGTAMSIAEMQKSNAQLGELTTSKISANIQALLTNPIGKPINEDGVIERSMDKKIARFTYVGATDEVEEIAEEVVEVVEENAD